MGESKKKAKKAREWWVRYYQDDSPYGRREPILIIYKSLRSAFQHGRKRSEVIKVREVLK